MGNNMTDSCIVCECEPLYPEDVYVNKDKQELICRWCVDELYKLREHKKQCFIDNCYCIRVDFER